MAQITEENRVDMRWILGDGRTMELVGAAVTFVMVARNFDRSVSARFEDQPPIYRPPVIDTRINIVGDIEASFGAEHLVGCSLPFVVVASDHERKYGMMIVESMNLEIVGPRARASMSGIITEGTTPTLSIQGYYHYAIADSMHCRCCLSRSDRVSGFAAAMGVSPGAVEREIDRARNRMSSQEAVEALAELINGTRKPCDTEIKPTKRRILVE